LGIAHRFHLVLGDTDDLAILELYEVALPAIRAVLRAPVPHHFAHPAGETSGLIVLRIRDSHPVHARSRRVSTCLASRKRRSRATAHSDADPKRLSGNDLAPATQPVPLLQL